MARLFKRLILSLSIATSIVLVLAADKDRTKFSPASASSYPAKQTLAQVTIAAEPFVNDEQARPAFGKANPYKYGILPVLVVIQNDGDQTLTFDELRVDYIQPDRNKVESTPASEVPFLSGPKEPKLENSPIPTGPRVSKNTYGSRRISALRGPHWLRWLGAMGRRMPKSPWKFCAERKTPSAISYW